MWHWTIDRLLVNGAVIVGALAVGCGGGSSTSSTDQDPIGETVVSSNVYADSVLAGRSLRYVFDGLNSGRYAIALSGLSADADLTLPVGNCLHGAIQLPGVSVEDCTVDVSNARLSVDVTGNESTNFTLLLGGLPVVATPVNEGAPQIVGLPGGPVQLATGTPVVGQVATRGTSYYVFTGLGAGPHMATLWGANDSAILHLYSDETYSLELDCTLRTTRWAPAECATTTNGTIYLSVSPGPLNRGGAVFLILVR